MTPARRPTPAYSPRFIRLFTRLFWWLARAWFRPTIEGWERIPPAPCLFVANHSGYGGFEILVMLTLWYRRFGLARPVAGLSHDVGLKWPLRWLVSRIGGIRASPATGKGLLRRGFDVLVFPGGFFDALRSFAARYEVHWNARSGFVRTAAEASVFIVPIVNCGSHAQYTLLPGGKQVARLLGLTRLKIGTWPIPLCVLALLGIGVGWIAGVLSGRWALLALIAALVPNPTRMDLRFLPAMDSRALLQRHNGDWAAAAEAIRGQMEQELRTLAKRRLTPWG